MVPIDKPSLRQFELEGASGIRDFASCSGLFSLSSSGLSDRARSEPTGPHHVSAHPPR